MKFSMLVVNDIIEKLVKIQQMQAIKFFANNLKKNCRNLAWHVTIIGGLVKKKYVIFEVIW